MRVHGCGARCGGKSFFIKESSDARISVAE
jgi:hypothetical protein